MIDWTLLEAAERSRQLELARALTQARKAQKPHALSPLEMLSRLERRELSVAQRADTRPEPEAERSRAAVVSRKSKP